MCGGVQYNHEGEVKKIYFPNPYAQLPVMKKDGELALVAWGRRKQQHGGLPQGGWARQESIDKGIWQKWSPTPVKIIVDRFMEKDKERVSHWFELKEGEWIQGLSRTKTTRLVFMSLPLSLNRVRYTIAGQRY